MIQLICSNCRAELSVDDAFAGGVCRCQHCGTIQTVPKKSRRDSAPAPSKTIYSKPNANAAARGDLETLADAVTTSSGLSSKRLRQKTIEYATPERSKPKWIYAAAAGGLAAALLVLLGLFTARSAVTPAVTVRPAARTGAGLTTPPPPTSTTPQFLGQPIDAPSIVYILDRGSGASEWFSYLLEATFRSTATLGGDRKFQILFWSNGDGEPAFPSEPQFATESTVAAARKALDSLDAHGQSEPIEAIERALSKQPAMIVIATGKGTQLDRGFVDAVLAARGGRKTRIDGFNIADSEIGSALTDLAKATGGTASLISEEELRRFARQ